MSSPPSYHSLDGMWTAQAIPPGASEATEICDRATEPEVFPPHHLSREEELMVGQRSGNDRRRHRRPCRSSSSHNNGGVAKLVLQELRSRLLGSDAPENSRRAAKGRSVAAGWTMSDSNVSCGDVHYTVHNHWPGMSPWDQCDGHLSCSQTWVGDDSTRPGPGSFPCLGSGGTVPDFEFDAQPASHQAPQRPLFQGDPTSMNFDFCSSTFLPHEPGAELLLKDSLDHFLGHPPNGHFYSCPAQGVWVGGQSGPGPTTDDEMHEWGRHSPDIGTDAGSASRRLYDQARPRGHHRECRQPVHHNVPWSRSANSGRCMVDAAAALGDYNRRWDYIDGIQHPYLAELPWPRIRSGVSFDHMKCDVFSFFARGCGLQPDDGKAPKLDFKLSSRSPYPSYDRRHQEGERRKLKAFKEQMKREKMHWHEDRLGKKFPEVMDADEEGRKAVWAAIVEGSAICDRRLRHMR